MSILQIALSPEWRVWLEYSSVVFNLVFIILVIREHILCWLFGILGSLTLAIIWASDDVRLYSEGILYLLYALFGVYGWIHWNRKKDQPKLKVVSKSLQWHSLPFLVAAIGTIVLGFIMSNYTTASIPWVDATTTSFSLLATWMEARKIIEGWYYWIVLNFASIFIYAFKDVNGAVLIMIAYFVLSVVGLIAWRKQLRISDQTVA
ncbi:MAG: hypothetical protein GC181_16230 [Bacteroidetes bacterium]|nr:hypothetical protein [Bacteroidota bacterium]